MDTIGGNFDGYGNRRYGEVQFSPYAFMQAPISALLEYAGVLRSPVVPSRMIHSENDNSNDSFVGGSGDDGSAVHREHGSGRMDDSVLEGSGGAGGEVSIRIIGLGERNALRAGGGGSPPPVPEVGSGSDPNTVVTGHPDGGDESGFREDTPSYSSFTSDDSTRAEPEDVGNTASANNRDGLLQRYDLQQITRWAEKFLPFLLLLLVVFIRQHLQGVTGFFVTLWVAAVMFKSNDILRKQTALKGERKVSVLVSFTIIFTLHVVEVYWWYRNDGLIYPLFMVPPKVIPPFWHAVFIITVNDTMVRQAAMVVKCMLLIFYRNSRGRSYRRQGQMLTLVEYLLLLYRALLPAPVWYRFFLNKEYGSLFSSLTTGLYLTFKLTSIVEKVQSFFTAFKALSRKEVQYGSYATLEQVIAAGDLCAICQEKIHAPILLHCKHIFCEDCVSEWFERERTCPLCRALVKSAELKSYGDGSTSLFFQLF